MRHFIEPNSFSLDEQLALLDLADRMEADPAPYAHLCDGRILAIQEPVPMLWTA